MKLKGLSLAAVLIAIVVIGIISLFFGKFYVLMAQTYDQISVRSEIQRNMRKVAAYIVPEVWEASPATSAGFAFLEPTSTSPTSSTLRFTRPVNLSNPSSPAFETIRYEYVANEKILYRQVEGSANRLPVCTNLSSLTFTWLSTRSVRLNFTASREARGADRQLRTISASGETFLVANDQYRQLAGNFSTSTSTSVTTTTSTTSIAPTNTYTAHNFLITSVNYLNNSSIQPFLVFGSGTGARSYRLHFEYSGSATSGKWWDLYRWSQDGVNQGWLSGSAYWNAMNNTAAAFIGGSSQATCQQVAGEYPTDVVVNTTDLSAGTNNHSGLQIVNEASLGGGLTYEMHLLGDTNNYTTAVGGIINTSGVDIAKLKPYLDASWVQDQINNNTALGQKLK